MPTIYKHEMSAYKVEIESLNHVNLSEENNLTHASLAISNRANLIVVGLCGLVEAYLFQLSENCESPFKLEDIRGQGISRLKTFLSRTKVVVFSELKFWQSFNSAYKIRNEIVHSYGGMVLEEASNELNKALAELKIQGCLVASRRIRLSSKELGVIFNTVDNLLNELGAYAT
ncbi:hypothetical protein GBN24_07955 [Plesiomonas shigelloides]|uniref:hypothetical protein n=1 Tax=Plesiomonas shigelloides TaxID=703 RepID=UPI001262AB44|nr:hypothetical protein [Plesiomonas shigelloides]KAB7690750.1 hypothetical protein GBN24_07955 [Plesiomonas shigelloides]